MNFLPIYAFHPSFQLPLSRAIVWQASSIHRAAVFVYIQLTAHSQYSAANPKCLTLETIFSFRHGPKLLLFVAFELTERVPTAVLLAGLLDGAISRFSIPRQCFCNQIEFQSYVRIVASRLLQSHMYIGKTLIHYNQTFDTKMTSLRNKSLSAESLYKKNIYFEINLNVYENFVK